MELILSGYGLQPTNTMALCSIEKDSSVRNNWQTSIDNPSFICEGDGYLFAITEAKDNAYIYLYQRSGAEYQLLDQKHIEGGYLCHITYSSNNKALFGACYETGTVFSVRVEDGKFGQLLFHEIQLGEDPNALTRAHCVLLNRSETVLVTVNIALDRIYYYDIKDGYLSLAQILPVPKGIGPRHVVYSEDEKLLYAITEYSNEILIYENTEQKGLLQRVSTLEPSFNGTSNCSTLCFSKNKDFLYAANRGAETIALFSVNADGTLERLKEYDCGGKHPRHMIVTQDGSHLVICNQNSNNLAIYGLDIDSGEILNQIASLEFPAPSGILETSDNK